MHDMKLVMDNRGKSAVIYRQFPSCLLPLCQNESSYETFHIKLCSFSCKSKSISYEKFCARTRFETVAQGNSEMAHSFNSSEPL